MNVCLGYYYLLALLILLAAIATVLREPGLTGWKKPAAFGGSAVISFLWPVVLPIVFLLEFRARTKR